MVMTAVAPHRCFREPRSYGPRAGVLTEKTEWSETSSGFLSEVRGPARLRPSSDQLETAGSTIPRGIALLGKPCSKNHRISIEPVILHNLFNIN